MDLGWIEDFLALAEHGGFSRAAEERRVTQPAFGRRIRALERWVETPLVDRSSHRIRLTAAGEAFRVEAAGLVGHLQLARTRAIEAASAADARVAMASTHMLASTFLPGRLAETAPDLREDVSLQLLVDNMLACERLMLDGRVGLLLCHHHAAAPSPLDGRGFVRAVIGRDRLVAVSAPDSSGSPLHPLRPDGAAAYLAYGDEAGLGRVVAATLLVTWAPHLRPVFQSHVALTLARMAREGRGLAFAPQSLVEADLRNGVLVRAGTAEMEVEICLIRTRSRQRAAFEALWSRLASSPA